MAIDATDLKKLWGLAAGRCSRPGCDDECIRYLGDAATVIGEMAHVIAKKPSGPRGVAAGGDDSYENLILLCPTHHTEIDKAPAGTFPVELLLEWKAQHEAQVKTAFVSPIFTNIAEIANWIQRLLIENRAVWKTYGPESLAAQANPISNLSEVWVLRKLSTIVPNNRRICDAIKKHSTLIPAADYEIACQFIEHAEGFEANCYERREGVPRFPPDFATMIRRHGGL
jgi:hypothetical protein